MTKRKPLRRANGQGTVFKLSGRRRKPWIAQVTIGYELDMENQKGKRLYETLGYFEKKTDAETALLLYNSGLVEAKSDMTLQNVYDVWSKNKFKEKLSKSTIDGYKASWKKLDSLKNKLFAEIRSDEFQDIIDDSRDNKNASKSTLTKLKSLIYVLCEYAYHNNILKTNYSELIKTGEVEKNERNAFNDMEMEIFKKNIDKIPWIDTVLVLCYTGARPTEMLTLTKFNVDLENKLITGGIKTPAGKNRIIPIHPVIYPIIKKWYNKNGETIFCNEEGKPLTARAYREKRYRPALESVGVRPLDPYCCRHTFATMMNRINAPSANVQKIMGHVVGSDITDKVYTHPEIEELRQTIEMLP